MPEGADKAPLVMNASSTARDFAIKLARLSSRIGPIIAATGGSTDFLRQLEADAVINYRFLAAADKVEEATGG